MSVPTFTAAQVNLYADDVETCAEFYRHLGFGERFRTPAEGTPVHVEVTAPGGLTVALTSAAVGNGEYDLGVTVGANAAELALWCEDTDAAYDAALAAGAASRHVPVDTPDGRLRFAWVTDPAGHLVKIVQRR